VAEGLSSRRRKAKQDKLLEAVARTRQDYKTAYEFYIRLYRLEFGMDPDPEEVSIEWDEE
jgi:hypothetical protein